MSTQAPPIQTIWTPDMLLPLINPALHPRYSPNLFAWVKSQTASWAPLTVLHPNPSACRGRTIGILDGDEWLSGSDLNGVLCFGKKEKRWAFGPQILKKSGVDETFWERYVKDGRCAIDPKHERSFKGDDTRWNQVGNTRECLWCGKHVQVLLEWTEIVKKSQWVPA